MSAGFIPSPPPPLAPTWAPPSPLPSPPPPIPATPPPPAGIDLLVIIAIAAACVACAVLAGMLAMYRKYYHARPLMGQSTMRDSISDYRDALDQRPVVRRSSTIQNLIPPLDRAMVNGEPLQVKPTYTDRAEYIGLLVRAVCGTRGRPHVTVIGTPEDAPIEFDIDKRHLTRARLAEGADVEREGRLAWQARFGASLAAL